MAVKPVRLTAAIVLVRGRPDLHFGRRSVRMIHRAGAGDLIIVSVLPYFVIVSPICYRNLIDHTSGQFGIGRRISVTILRAKRVVNRASEGEVGGPIAAF